MTIYELLDVLYGCYENYVPVSYRSLINTLQYLNIPFTHNVYETTEEVRTPYEPLPYKLSQCAVDINIELYNEGLRIVITMVNDHITHIDRELSYSNMFMNCTSLEKLIINCIHTT